MRLAPDLGSIDSATAARLIGQYMPIVQQVVLVFPSSEREDLRAVGRVAILEGYLWHEPHKGSNEATWIRKVIHWRIMESVERLPEDCGVTGRAEVLDGKEIDHNPELGYLKHLVLAGLRHLQPRQQTIVLALLEGETFDEISRSIGISPQATHKAYAKAVRELQHLVSERHPR